MPFVARPTVYSGIQMRSRLEATFAGFLDRHDFDWQYEPSAFAGAAGQYLPDFVIEDVGTSWDRFYIDVKGSLDRGQAERLGDRMEIIRASDPDASLAVITASYEGRQHAGFRFAVNRAGDERYWQGSFGLCACGAVSIVTWSDARPKVPALWCRGCDAPSLVALLSPFHRVGT